MTELISEYTDIDRPDHFTRSPLRWLPWLAPPAEDELTEEQRAGFVDPSQARRPYFRLLSRDPQALKARTLTNIGIFGSAGSGLSTGERELAATVTSRVNGCVYCASVHAPKAARDAHGDGDVDRLLADGVSADLGNERWNAIAMASASLTATPLSFAEAEVERLRNAGLDDSEIIDVVTSAAFFNWANRLMLSLGEPEVPRQGRHA
jgi:alkylhydroperoxidase domain protein